MSNNLKGNIKCPRTIKTILQNTSIPISFFEMTSKWTQEKPHHRPLMQAPKA